MWGFSKFLDTLQSHGQWIPEPARGEAVRAGRAALLAYANLSAEAGRMQRAVWCMKPKFHAFDHILRALAASGRNPSWAWCFAHEDFVGRISKLSSKCHARQASLRTLERYLIRIRLMLAGRARI